LPIIFPSTSIPSSSFFVGNLPTKFLSTYPVFDACYESTHLILIES
jgi:hypothetical protein